MKATSVRLDDETLKRVGRMAEAMDRPRAWLMAHAIKKFVEQEEWFIREVELGIDAADEGHLKEHADVKAKWEAKTCSCSGLSQQRKTSIELNNIFPERIVQ